MNTRLGWSFHIRYSSLSSNLNRFYRELTDILPIPHQTLLSFCRRSPVEKTLIWMWGSLSNSLLTKSKNLRLDLGYPGFFLLTGRQASSFLVKGIKRKSTKGSIHTLLSQYNFIWSRHKKRDYVWTRLKWKDQIIHPRIPKNMLKISSDNSTLDLSIKNKKKHIIPNCLDRYM